MPNLYKKLMSKDMPAAAPAPTARQMVQPPMGLRSAMKRYADGGDITVAPPMVTSAVPDYSRAYGALGGAEGVNALRNQLLGMGIGEDVIGSALSRYYAPEEPKPQTMTPPEPRRPIAPETPYDLDPRLEKPRQEPTPEPRPNPAIVMPEIYPQDYAGPRTSGPQQPQGPRTSYRQEADGTLTEIGYDGQPISSYTPEQMAMQNATTGVTPSEFQYVWNGQGYDKVRTGGITMDDGTFIAGADNGQGGVDIGGPAFFAKYANEPATMDLLRQMYGFTGDQPVYQQPQVGYNPEVNIPPPIPYNPADNPVNGYNEPEVQKSGTESERLSLLKRAMEGQGVGSLADSQKLASLLQSLGYSK